MRKFLKTVVLFLTFPVWVPLAVIAAVGIGAAFLATMMLGIVNREVAFTLYERATAKTVSEEKAAPDDVVIDVEYEEVPT